MKRIVFLDYLRVIAILMVLAVHSCESFYFGEGGSFHIQSLTNARWVVAIDSAMRACVPLFVMASAYLLFPLTRPTGEFFRRRLLRVGLPFIVWCCVYNWWNHGNWWQLLFNFPAATGGHLWFVPMLFGLYLLMPLLSPWAEKVTEKELRSWLIVWLVSTTLPYLRLVWGILFADGWGHVFGTANFDAIPFLYGECAWNSFGTFHYVSGFIGYMLMGLYFRRFVAEVSWRKTLALAVPLALVGYLAVAVPFYLRIANYGETFPITAPYAAAVELETSWEYCSTGVALTVFAYFLVIRKLTFNGGFYRYVIRPLADASYGVYLVHILILVPTMAYLSSCLGTGAAIIGTTVATFALSSLVVIIIRLVPVLKKMV